MTLNNTPRGRFIPWCDFTRNFCVHSPQAKGKGGRALLVSAGVVFPKTDDAKPSATGESGRMGVGCEGGECGVRVGGWECDGRV